MEQALLIGGIVVVLLLICLSMREKKSCGHYHQRLPMPPVQYINLSKPQMRGDKKIEGSLGSTPYSPDARGEQPPTVHSKNKTEGLWMAGPSQADYGPNGLGGSEITSEFETPFRIAKTGARPGGVSRDTLQSHI